jgi:hypothetical protein
MYAKPKPEEPAKPEPSDEVREAAAAAEDAVFKWRLDQLTALGVPVVDALALASRADSPHQVRTLLRSGCDVGMAVRIVL